MRYHVQLTPQLVAAAFLGYCRSSVGRIVDDRSTRIPLGVRITTLGTTGSANQGEVVNRQSTVI